MIDWYRKGFLGLSLISILLSAAIQADERAPAEYYQVQPGDTLWDITERHFGEAEEWPTVKDSNQVEEPRHIQPGDVLALPNLSEMTAKVRHRSGAAWLTRHSGQRLPLQADMLIRPGDILETGPHAFVSLRLPSGAEVVLPSNTQVVLKQQDHRHAQLYLERGELEAQVPPRRNHGEVLSVDTPTGIVGVRGTHFRVSHTDGNTRVSTLTGEVALSHEQDTASVSAGRGALSRRHAAIHVTDLLSAPRLTKELFSHGQPLRLRLSKVSGATNYRVQLAHDPDFQTLFRDKRTDSSSITFQSVPQGFYYVRGSAVDSLGLEGRYDRHLILHRPIQVRLEAADGTYSFHWTDIPQLKYRLQLAEDDSFDEPFMSRAFSRSRGVTLRNLPTDTFFWRLQVSEPDSDALPPTVIASGRQGAARQP